MAKEKKAKNKSRPRADSGGLVFEGLNDPALLEFIRSGQIGGGVGIDGRQALCNAALYRCITLISQSIGMLPLNVLHNDDGRETATEHPVWKSKALEDGFADGEIDVKEIEQSGDSEQKKAMALIESSLAQQGYSRAQRRDVFNNLFHGTPSAAAPAAMPCAGGDLKTAQALQTLIQTMKG